MKNLNNLKWEKNILMKDNLDENKLNDMLIKDSFNQYKALLQINEQLYIKWFKVSMLLEFTHLVAYLNNTYKSWIVNKNRLIDLYKNYHKMFNVSWLDENSQKTFLNFLWHNNTIEKQILWYEKDEKWLSSYNLIIDKMEDKVFLNHFILFIWKFIKNYKYMVWEFNDDEINKKENELLKLYLKNYI